MLSNAFGQITILHFVMVILSLARRYNDLRGHILTSELRNGHVYLPACSNFSAKDCYISEGWIPNEITVVYCLAVVNSLW